MKICAAQTRPVKGNIDANIANHKTLVAMAVANEADTIIFPELSITGYEPELAAQLATVAEDTRFDEFQTISDTTQITIAVGMPLKSDDAILIGMLFFKPNKPRQTYCKQYLHADELPYFVSAPAQPALMDEGNKIAMAICYELSVPQHAINAHKNGAEIYVASVAKTASGMEKAAEILAATASKYSMAVLLVNCVGHCDNFDCGGKSSAWNNKGELMGQLNDTDEGLLIFDTVTSEIKIIAL